MKIVPNAVVLGALLSVMPVRADVAVLLEEPMGSFFSGNPAHISIYFSRICAESPVILRLCAAGEPGAVLSRYHRIDGLDWVAMPLIPYLYSVSQTQEIPASASLDQVESLREAYRRKHLAEIAPEPIGPHSRSRDWPQLVGEAYDRTLYGFTLATTQQQDEELIRRLNSGPNRNQFNIAFRNCANFVAQILDFYYPGAVGFSWLTPGIMTPKHVAQAVVEYSQQHPDLSFSAFEIRQVPGAIERSKPVHGVLSLPHVRGAGCGHPGVVLPGLACVAA